ncbi:MAG: beta-ketoacyl-ACP synthase II [candidate division Zixibacteria bacterium]|nr:beta-ketoacyl-ACP synthase II [candidate division Zixibacteria bacterium]
MRNQVVITGMGLVSPIGNTLDEFRDSLLNGKSGIGLTTKCDCSELTSKISGEVKGFDPLDFMTKKESRRVDLSQQYAIAAAHMAYDDSGLGQGNYDSNRAGVVIGSGIGGIITFENQHSLVVEGKANRISPFFIPMMIADMSAGMVSIRLGFKGPNYAAVSACASGSNAIGDAFQIIQRGSADIMITGGTEAAITVTAIAGFCNAKALSTRNDAPEKASRPFDKDRDGFIISEGSGIIVLENEEHARKRGAKIYGEMVGLGMSADAFHMTAPSPDGDGAARSMQAAIADAGISKDDINYINTHGTSTGLGDIAECLAIQKVFGDRAKKIPCNSTKSMTGHLLGATGAVEVIASLLQMKNKKLHPTTNHENPEEQCDLYFVHDGPIDYEIEYMLSNSFGFGGHNISLLLKNIANGI